MKNFKWILLVLMSMSGLSASAAVRVAEKPDVLLMVLVPLDFSVQLVSSGGDSIGNGGGEDKKRIVQMERQLKENIHLCVMSGFCPVDIETQNFLMDLASNSSRESLIEFKTSREVAELSPVAGYERLIYTEEKMGSPNIVNSLVLEAPTELEALTLVMNLYAHHYPFIRDDVKIRAITSLVRFMARIGMRYPLTEWNQPHIQAISMDRDSKLLITDGSKVIVLEQNYLNLIESCAADAAFVLPTFAWGRLTPGAITADAGFNGNCRMGEIQSGQLLLNVSFAPVDWNQFFLNSAQFKLELQDVNWQLIYF